jgi:DNA topoisomerase-1
MHEEVRVVAGECTATFDDGTEREHRGQVLTVVKPDNTVLVHDADGYQPVAWLTRAETVQFVDGTLEARDGDQRLRIDVHDEHMSARHPVSHAGLPAGTCPDCEAVLVLSAGTVRCLGCSVEHAVPRDAAILDESCGECGLPKMRVERGRPFMICLDRDCESLDTAVTDVYDREWDCPECGSDLRILRRGGLIAGCERYPDCDTGFSLPTGVVDGTCACGLPTFDTPTGAHCLDRTCEEAGQA